MFRCVVNTLQFFLNYTVINPFAMINKTTFALLFVFVLFSCTKEKAIEAKLETYNIPGNQFFPEGIAYNSKAGVFYVGSVATGDIAQVNVTTGEASLFAPGAFQNRSACTGMTLDFNNRLWVCGGADNKIHVFNLSGNPNPMKTWDTKALFGSGFINDCAADESNIYFTDTRERKIYRTSVLGSPGTLEEWLVFTDQQIPYSATGTNANGIVLTPDNKYVIIVVSYSGKLYRIDKSSKNITEIQLNTPVTSGDGLVLDGNKLYVSRNAIGQIYPVTLNSDYSQGTVGTGFGTNLLFNTTMAKVGNYLLVVNGQLNRRASTTNPNPPAPSLPFTVSRVAIP